MFKSALAYFFTLVLAFVLIAPSAISFIEDAFEVSISVDFGEEESNEKETKTIEFNTSVPVFCEASDMNFKERRIIKSNCLLHSALHQENISPPPEHII